VSLRLAAGALATVAALSLSATGRAGDDPAAAFKADLAKVLDRYNDAAAVGRLDQGIALCNSRLAVKTDDVAARLELASLKMAKNDLGGALAEAERATRDSKDAKSEETRWAHGIAFAALLGDAELQLQREKDPGKLRTLQAELDRKVSDESQALADLCGSDQAAMAIVAKEQGLVETLKGLAEVGSPPRAIGKKDTAGKEIALDSYAGKVLLIDFWATWCPPCVAGLPNVIATYEKWNGKGFEVLGVSLDDDRAALDAFVKAKKVPWRQYFDGKGWENDVAKDWDVHAIPKTYLVDHTGRVRFVGVEGEELERAVQELIERADKAAKAAKTPEPPK
jgi:thiol-disulfide isomerase/thioredoxin